MSSTDRLRTVALAALVAAGLSACAHDKSASLKTPEPLTPTERYAIQVTPQQDQIALRAHAQGLSPAQQEALADLAGRWIDQGGEETITVRYPAGGAPQSAEIARQFLVARGAAPGRVQLATYQGPPDAPLLVGFTGYVAMGPRCDQLWSDLTATYSNSAYKPFGCAVTANTAVQVANPKDLIRPRDMDGIDPARRSVVLDKYRAGEVTSSAKDDQAKGTVANAVSN